MKRHHTLIVLSACILATAMGALVAFAPDLDATLDWRLSNAGAVSVGVLACGLLWLTPVLLSALQDRDLDWLSPRIVFGFIYLLSSLGRPILSYMAGFAADRVVWFYAPAIPDYILMTVLGQLAFLIGTLSGERRSPYRQSSSGGHRDRTLQLTPSQLRRLGKLATWIMVVSVMISTLFNSMQFFDARRMGTEYGEGQFSSGLDYYMLILSKLLFPPALVIASYAAIKRGAGRPPQSTIVLMGIYLFSNALGGDRGMIMVALFTFALVWHYFVRRLRPVHFVVGTLALSFYSFAVVSWRSTGWSFADAWSAITRGGFIGESFRLLIGDIGSPAFITTHALIWFPDSHSFYYGRTYADAVLSLIPGFFFGGRLARPFISPALIFKDLFEGGRFNPSQGYGFSLIGEAYMNFGWFGPPLVMFGIGWLLHRLYGKAQGSGSKWFYEPLFLIVFASFPFALRSDAVALVKHLVYGVSVLMAGSWWIKVRAAHPRPHRRARTAAISWAGRDLLGTRR